MITYEEFIKQNHVEKGKLTHLNFDKNLRNDSNGYGVNIFTAHKDYISVAQEATELTGIQISETGSKQYYSDVAEFIQNCNGDVKVKNKAIIKGTATVTEFLEAEDIINQILSEINPDWSSKQKLAYVYYKIGELISYIPDFNYINRDINSPQASDSRNIWKSIIEGKSVCNGITSIQRTILSRMGISTRELSSGTHSFLLTETEEGNIITDATWDLTATLYKGKPKYFGVTYEELRSRERGLSNAHRLERPPENVISISEEELREIYYSVGLTKEDRKFYFPILDTVLEFQTQEFDSLEQKINGFLEIFTQTYSKEATHLQETRGMLERVMGDLGIERKTMTSGFVYSNDDEECMNPHLIMHFNTEEMKRKVKFFNLAQMRFEDMDIEQLDQSYKQHDLKLIKPFWKAYLPEKQVDQSREAREELEDKQQ